MRRLTLLFLTGLLAFAGDKGQGSKDVELKKAIAGGLAELAAWAQPKKLNTEARALADEALVLDAAHAKAKEIKEKAAGDSAASEADQKEWATRKAAFGKKIAPLYIDLSKQKHAAKEDAVFDGYFVRGFEWAPKEAGPLLDGAWRDAVGKKDWGRAYRLLSGAQRVVDDPARAKALKDVELREGERTPLLRKASAHDMQYYLVLPKDWTPAKKWPILVYVEGAGANFKGAIENLAGQRGDFNAILITPQTFSSTNNLVEMKAKYTYDLATLEKWDAGARMKFDEEGFLNVLADVKKDFNGEDKIYITGFSGGGNLTWQMVFCHPEMLVAAAPACPNFYEHNLSVISTDAARETLPVKVFQGDKDEYIDKLLNPQWDSAKKIADEKGWKNVSREMVPGAGHDTCWKLVLAFFKGQKK
ncbi:MAG: hypothetical protein AAB074_22305 [Planctomycetota bacterium]